MDKEEKRSDRKSIKTSKNYFDNRENTASPCHSTYNEDTHQYNLLISGNLGDGILIKLCITHIVAHSLSCAFSIL